MCFTAMLDTGGIFPYSHESLPVWERLEPFPAFLFQSAAARPVVPVVTMEDPGHFQPMRWLLVPPWITTAEQVRALKIWTANARIEELEHKPLFRPLTRSRRCAVLFTGFYEWRHEQDGSKTRYLLTLPERRPMLLPGLWTEGLVEGQSYRSCTVCTMEATGLMRYIHNSKLRQPVVVEAQDITPWLDENVAFPQAREAVLDTQRSATFVPDPPVRESFDDGTQPELPW